MPTKQDITDAIKTINQKLDGTGVKLEKRGNSLNLRAILPKRVGTGTEQQRISLGLKATLAEIGKAESKAWELHAQRLGESFNWDKWEKINKPKPEKIKPKTCGELIEEFKKKKFAQGIAPQTWDLHYWQSFKKLPLDKPLTETAIMEVVLTRKPNSMVRKETCEHLTMLAKFAGLEVDLKPYRGNYSTRKVKPRKLPTDEEIEQVRSHFENNKTHKQSALEWQWVYGVMAAYGLRDCEVMFCKIEPEPPYRCNVLKGKTGERVAFPLNPQWVREWQLFDMRMPKMVAETPWYCGQKVASALCRYLRRMPEELRHKPYDLRHAYALRGATKYNIPARIMAGMMGHTIDVHLKIYSRWLNQSDIERVYLGAINGF